VDDRKFYLWKGELVMGNIKYFLSSSNIQTMARVASSQCCSHLPTHIWH